MQYITSIYTFKLHLIAMICYQYSPAFSRSLESVANNECKIPFNLVKSLHYLTSKWRGAQGGKPRRTSPRAGGVGETGEERQERAGTGRKSKKGKPLLFFYC